MDWLIWMPGDDIDDFLKEVIPPDEDPEGYYDGIAYEEAIKVAKSFGEAGKPLLNALYAMRHSVAA